MTAYFHAGTVSRVDQDGGIAAVVEFDPVFDANDPEVSYFQRTLEGMTGIHRGFPNEIEEKIRAKYQPHMTFVRLRGDPQQQGEVRRRIERALVTERTYVLCDLTCQDRADNCQTFATEMSTGVGWSDDSDSLARALDYGFNSGQAVPLVKS